MPIILDFDAAPNSTNDYSEDGYTVITASNFGADLIAISPTSNSHWYVDSPSLAINYIGFNATLTRDGGGSFNLGTINLDGVYQEGIQTVTFIANLAAGGTQVFNFAIDTTLGWQTFDFGNILVSSLVFDSQDYPYYKFDQIEINPNASPAVSGPVSLTSNEDAPAFSVDLLAGSSDGDGDTLGVSGLTLDSGDDSGITDNGTSLDVDPNAYNHLADGDSEVIVYSYTIDDGNGGTIAQTATITIAGVNDGPTVSAAVSATTNEDALNSSVDLLANASDVDDGAVLSITNLTTNTGNDAGIALNGTDLDIDTSAYNYLAAGESEVITYSYDVTDEHGATAAQTASITIDGVNDGPTANDDVLGTVNSVQLVTNGGFESGTTGWTLTDGGSGGWSVESDTLPPSGAYTTPGPQSGIYYIVSYQTGPGVHALEQSFTIPTGTISLSLGFAMFAQTAAGEFINIAGLDPNASPNQHARVDLLIEGSSALSTSVSDIVRNFYLGIDGASPQPWTVYTFDITGDVIAGGTFDLRFAQVDNQNFFNLGIDAVTLNAEVLSALTDEDTAIVIDGAGLLANDTDPDTSDTLTISGVSGLSNLGAAVLLNGDGTISYDPSGALDYLAEGEVVEDTFTYTISDGNGGTDTATVRFNIVGINDAPSAPVDTDGPSGASISEHLAVGSVIGLDVNSTDPEGDPINYFFRNGVGDAVQTLGKFTIDASTGVVTLAAAVNFELQTSYTLTIYAGDGSAETSSDFTVAIENVYENWFTPNGDGTAAAPINFNLVADGSYDFGTQYDALAGNDFVYLPNMASVDAGNPWDYNRTFDASAGNDVVQGGDGNDTISGGDGNDTLFGGLGDDRLVGSSGNDILGGGDGTDKLTGASGKDIFIFTDSELGTTKLGEHDTITDFKQGEDKIDISALYDGGTYSGLKNGALNGTVSNAYKVGYYSASGKTWLEGDVDGNGVADWIIEMSGSYKLKGSDIVVGPSIIDSIAAWNAATGSLPYAQHHQDDYFL